MNASIPPVPHVLALLVMSFGAAIIAYAVARRPHEPSSWAIAAATAGVLGIYLSEYFLYRPGLSVEAGFFWQKVMSVGAGIASIGAVALALTLRETVVSRWEQLLAGALVLRAVLDIIFIVTLTPQLGTDCIGPWGSPMLYCGTEHLITSIPALLSIPLAVALFYRTFRLASDTRRRVFIAYLLPAFLLICLGSTISILWGLRGEGPLFPTGIIVAPAAAFAAAGLLHLEAPPQADVRLPAYVPWLVGWTGLIALALVVDLRWLRGQTPLASLFTLIGGLAVALAYLARCLPLSPTQASVATEPERATPVSSGFQQPSDERPVPAVVAETASAAGKGPRLRIYLFGPFSVERDSERLPNHAKFWHSDKSRSLLAYLVLAGKRGVTRNQLVDALWPLPDDGDGEAEQRGLNALRSYISILRKVLEPDKPRPVDSIIAHDGDRYRLVSRGDVWVDVWEFRRWAAEAERLTAAHEDAAAAEAWERAIALHGELGLLPDEQHLPAEVVEPERERLRQQWLRGVRWQARYGAQHGPIERAVTLWETVLRAVPLDAEAYRWLAAHYRGTGQAEQLAALMDAWRRAEAELGGEEGT